MTTTTLPTSTTTTTTTITTTPITPTTTPTTATPPTTTSPTATPPTATPPTAAVADLERSNPPASSPRRRGLSSLRRLGPPSPGEPSRLSPRSYFFRSVSYPQNSSNPPAPPNVGRNTPQPSGPQNLAANDLTKQTTASRDTSDPSTQTTTHPTTLRNGPTTSPLAHNTGADPSDMARHRPSNKVQRTASESARNAEAQRFTMVGEDASDDAGNPNNAQTNGNPTNAQTNGTAQETPDERSRPPTIRFFPHQEVRQGRPSLTFAPVVRTLPNESSIIRVGRYSEREGVPVSNPTGPSDAPVGFKSKVVSRKHCEFSFVNGSWQIKDVSSSSGTFLNHIRLSQPNTESRLYPVKDGDILQLGIDFRGGEEMIFRCVKIRIECNRAWQKRPNNFK